MVKPGRAGVSYEDVKAVANSLDAKDIRPTISAVRMCLGTGSSNTISRHLQVWKSTQPAKQLPALSESFIQAIQQELARHANAVTENLKAELEEASEARDLLLREIDEQAEHLDGCLGQLASMQSSLAEMTGKFQQLLQERATLEQRLLDLAKEKALQIETLSAREREAEAQRRAAEARTEAAERRAAEADAREKSIFQTLLAQARLGYGVDLVSTA